MRGGGGQNRNGGGGVKFYPYKRWGGNKGYTHAEFEGWGHKQFFWAALTWELQVLAILKGGKNIVHPLKGGGGGRVGVNIVHCFPRWGKMLWAHNFPMLCPPPM